MKKLTAREALSYGMFGDTAKFQDVLRGNGSLSAARRTLTEACRELRDAIADQAVTAWGYRADPNQPSLMSEMIPWKLFVQFTALAVNHCCETFFLHPASPENIPTWNNVTFDRKEIQNLWPKTNATLDAWMASDFAANPIKKRDDRLGDCRKATGCTAREAKAAYEKVTPDKKLRRGQKIAGKLK